MRRIFNWVGDKCLDRFSRTVHIYLDPDQVVFRTSDDSLKIAPLIYIATESEKFRVLGIGNERVPDMSTYKLDVFNFRNVRAKTPLDPEQCLAAFFGHAFRDLMDSNIFVRPNIKVYDIDRLTAILPENKKAYLQRVLIAAGARTCEFI